jgi:hypothetical protein
MSLFKELSKVDVGEYTEKKGKFTYLSWSYAVQELLRRVPDAEWEMPEPTVYQDGSMMVWCKLTANGITRTAYLPVTDHTNKPIQNPNCFAVNTAMQRCLAKAIALHGLGLYIYSGEDLPTVTDYDTAGQILDDGDMLAFLSWFESLSEENQIRVFNDAPSGHKVAFKKRINDGIASANKTIDDYFHQVSAVLERSDASGFAQLWDEMPDIVKRKMNARLDEHQKSVAKVLINELGDQK